jgi:hypothetical protein
MSPRDLAFVGCRMLAVYFLYGGVQGIPHGLYALSSAFGAGGAQVGRLFQEPALWLSFASPILSLAMVLVLWFGASWLSREVAEGTPKTTSTWSSQTLLSVGVVLLGLLLASFALPQIAILLLFIDDAAGPTESYQLRSLVGFGLQFIIGVGLVFGAAHIANAVARLRRWSAEHPQA